MPIKSAARRASCASSAEQQPRAPERNDCGFFDSAKCTPTTSWPASTARAAATAESTPPDIAAKTFTATVYAPVPDGRLFRSSGSEGGLPVGKSGAGCLCVRRRKSAEQRVHVVVGGRVPKRHAKGPS